MRGTLGKRWKLAPDVRAARAVKIGLVWKNKSVEEKANIRKKRLPGLRKAHKLQALAGMTPETNKEIRSKISRTMKKLRETVLPHNAGKFGYRNKGSWEPGIIPWIKGKKHSKETIKICTVAGGTSEQKRNWIKRHNKAVEMFGKELSKDKSLKVWTCFGDIPDLIVRKRGKLIAYEMTAKAESSYRMVKKKKHKDGFFDQVKWVDLDGKDRR